MKNWWEKTTAVLEILVKPKELFHVPKNKLINLIKLK